VTAPPSTGSRPWPAAHSGSPSSAGPWPGAPTSWPAIPWSPWPAASAPPSPSTSSPATAAVGVAAALTGWSPTAASLAPEPRGLGRFLRPGPLHGHRRRHDQRSVHLRHPRGRPAGPPPRPLPQIPLTRRRLKPQPRQVALALALTCVPAGIPRPRRRGPMADTTHVHHTGNGGNGARRPVRPHGHHHRPHHRRPRPVPASRHRRRHAGHRRGHPDRDARDARRPGDGTRAVAAPAAARRRADADHGAVSLPLRPAVLDRRGARSLRHGRRRMFTQTGGCYACSRARPGVPGSAGPRRGSAGDRRAGGRPGPRASSSSRAPPRRRQRRTWRRWRERACSL
jgi:hypothetical protein